MAEKKKEKLDLILNKLDEHDRRFDEYDRRFDEFSGKFGEILTGLDKIMKELEKAREDRVFAKAKDDEQDRRLGGLEERVEKIEAKAG